MRILTIQQHLPENSVNPIEMICFIQGLDHFVIDMLNAEVRLEKKEAKKGVHLIRY